ncbi:hypothetical protein [Microbulbifer aggregans]|uniref:hypothetical protein n=1 Tax=Microbulbifer aggregans TaxID=1769779 RepID=UPI001CFCC41B|nr:hypothetical protein [Microbulbifer aggregans]
MNELQRTEYLTALGVTSYMPRYCLPLAPEPVQALLPPAQADVPEAPTAPATLMAAVGADAAVPETVSSTAQAQFPVAPAEPAPAPEVSRVIGSITAEAKIAPTPSKPAAVAAPEKTVHPFVLNCWWLGEELLAVDSREPGTALPVESLFGNIIRALDWHQLATERDKLKWPLAENPFAAAAGASDARETCSSWLEAACGRKPVKSIWLMGQQAQEFCAPVPMAETVNEWQGIQVIAMPSLTELLTDPQRKRPLWQLLRKLYPEQTRR